MTKFELLAPAGDLEKLKVAVLYGADAVFIGGQNFSLRKRASNFTLEEIKEGCEFAHKYNKKVHVTCNIVMHNIDLDGLKEYLLDLEKCGVDAIITSSLYMAQLCILNTKMEVHISTQESTTSHYACEFYKKIGAKRVVLARELTLDEIRLVKENTDIDLEVFIHGGMCTSYSGRCMLSNNMTNRDANRGGCAHSCRWNYDLYEDDELKTLGDKFFSMSSKDLQAIRFIPKLIDLNINSFKIEGRMKSIHYVATVTNTYRRLIDEYLLTGKIKDYNYYIDMINKAENRVTSVGFLAGLTTKNEQLYDLNLSTPTKLFVAIVKSYDKDKKRVYIESRNYFKVGDNLEVFSPNGIFNFKLRNLFKKETDESIEISRHPLEELYFTIDSEDFDFSYYDLIRIA